MPERNTSPPWNQEMNTVSSGSGKTLVVASSHGNKVTEAKVQGKNVVVGLNAYIPKG